MGLGTKNVTKVSAEICKLLIGIVEQNYTNISNSILISELDDQGIKFLLEENFLTKGRDLEHYLDGDGNKYVQWYEHLNSFAYLSLSGLIKVTDDDLKTHDANISKIVNFFADEFEVTRNSRTKNNEHIEGFLYFIGDARLNNQKMVSIYFARRLSDPEIFRKVDGFFLGRSTTRLKKLILTSSYNIYPETTKTGAKIISVSKLLQLANRNNILFNLDYITNIIFGRGSESDLKPYAHSTEDGSMLFIGARSWKIRGGKQRQIIKIMCDNYASDPGEKLKWDLLLIEADIDEDTPSRFRDLFKDSKVKEAIIYDDGFVWFKT
jgi:hypothetical protein